MVKKTSGDTELRDSVEHVGNELNDLSNACEERNDPKMKGALRYLRDYLRRALEAA